MRSLALAVLAVTLLGCRDVSNRGGDDGDDAPPTDAPGMPDADQTQPGDGCTPRSPRGSTPEAFVGPTGLQARLTSLIDGAQTSLDLAMYVFTVSALADRVIAAKSRGVAVRVLFDPDHPGNTNTRASFNGAGVPNRNAPAIYDFSHAKYMIIDGKVAVIMSSNFDFGSMNDGRNYGMLDRDTGDVADLQAVFDQDWAAGGGDPPKPADLACTRLIVSPVNAKTRILELIDTAKTTLEVEAFYVTETDVRAAIGAAKQRGAAVRVLLESSSDQTETRSYLEGLGIPVHLSSGFFLHAKLIIADGVAFVGSENYSFTSLTRNREVGALVFEPAPAAMIKQRFDADWNATN
jgi:cardiolipin synthase A/B